MKSGFSLNEFTVTWLNGGRFELDGGAMFGVVPKALWQKKYPTTEDNYISMSTWPILVRTPKALVLIESGFGNKLTDKQKKIFRVQEEWSIPDELKKIGIDRGDINYVVLTHYDFDHAGGVIMQNDAGNPELTFPHALHIVQKTEWEDVVNPNARSINTYWPVNNEMLRGNSKLELVDGDADIVPGITVVRTGGHTRGYQIVRVESGNETMLHLGDLFPTHAHANPLWVMAYDNFPLDTVALKQKWFGLGAQAKAWFTFYHDPLVLACRLDSEGNIIERFTTKDV
ncbi:MAG TPA: MBL fold metallo-hydrolase [Nitrospirota bacterium]|nr:MBL fold metallo-hydrolase [Nitrospirota bacterium]